MPRKKMYNRWVDPNSIEDIPKTTKWRRNQKRARLNIEEFDEVFIVYIYYIITFTFTIPADLF